MRHSRIGAFAAAAIAALWLLVVNVLFFWQRINESVAVRYLFNRLGIE